MNEEIRRKQIDKVIAWNNAHKEERKAYMKVYYLSHKDKIKEQTKKNRKKYHYIQLYNKKKALEYNKKTNYKYEKTSEQRKIRNIKRLTRHFFPLKDRYCEVCFRPAEEHHHTTTPIEVDKFIYLCHSCHKKQHQLNITIGGINGNNTGSSKGLCSRANQEYSRLARSICRT